MKTKENKSVSTSKNNRASLKIKKETYDRMLMEKERRVCGVTMDEFITYMLNRLPKMVK